MIRQPTNDDPPFGDLIFVFEGVLKANEESLGVLDKGVLKCS